MSRIATGTKPKSFTDAIAYFERESLNAANLVKSLRWPKGVRCPVCGDERPYVDATRDGWECRNDHPKRKFTLKTGTIFEDSAVPLSKWLIAIWMFANEEPNSRKLARLLGVTQKTAWLMLLRIRIALKE